ncbi:MAG: hypothetical protein QOK06_839 [Acidimicrobiaceae bacterium]
MRGDAEQQRLEEDRDGTARWKWWGPYLSARQWGTVREDYSQGGAAWDYFPHDHARSRAYRWGEDGLGGICDRWQHLCFGLALWNEHDPILKERLYGLTNSEGNHGEDVKEYWWALDSTPTHSWMQWLYKYPQREFPYGELVSENRERGISLPEWELVDTGAFDEDRYFDVLVTYAKAAPDDICITIEATNRGPDPAPLHVLPTMWFRNTWAWGRDQRQPWLEVDPDSKAIKAVHGLLGTRWLASEGAGQEEIVACDNDTNMQRLYGTNGGSAFPKDGINDHVVHGAATVNPDRTGTKAAFWHRLTIAPGATETLRLRLTDTEPDDPFGASFATTVASRRADADEFYAELAPEASPMAKDVQRRAMAGLLWAKKHYRYDVKQWLEGDPAQPAPPQGRGRNKHWSHLYNADIISMPDEWEYPWYAAWDLAFHMIPLALVDAEFAKDQLLLFTREWFMHPNGQLPAYEWAFEDVNPPVHAWATWRVFKIDAVQSGTKDWDFLERIFHKLLMNFAWWVNRKDAEGNNLFEGGFLGLDNIGLFDRSRPLPNGHTLEQSDATSWMAMYCLNMLAIASELALHDSTYEDVCTKFFEHFLTIGSAATVRDGESLWDEEDGFFYDVLVAEDGTRIPLKVRSWVGLIPLFAVETFEGKVLERLPEFRKRAEWFVRKRPEQCKNFHAIDFGGKRERHFLSLVGPNKLRRILARMLDEDEFLSPHGLRSVSKVHEGNPVRLELDGEVHEVRYQPGDSDTHLFGGNSNWRGPIWFPLNYLMIESLQKFHHYLGDDFKVEFPTGSGVQMNLWEVSVQLSHRLISLFVPDEEGRRASNGGRDLFDFDPNWKDHPTFYEFFHGDDGKGLGASHQTGWTALVAKLIRQSGD